MTNGLQELPREWKGPGTGKWKRELARIKYYDFKVENYFDEYKLGSRVEHYLWLNIVNQSEANFMASDYIEF